MTFQFSLDLKEDEEVVVKPQLTLSPIFTRPLYRREGEQKTETNLLP